MNQPGNMAHGFSVVGSVISIVKYKFNYITQEKKCLHQSFRAATAAPVH